MTYFYLFLIIIVSCAGFDIVTRRFRLLPVAIAACTSLFLFLAGQSDIVIWSVFLAVPTFIYIFIIRSKK